MKAHQPQQPQQPVQAQEPQAVQPPVQVQQPPAPKQAPSPQPQQAQRTVMKAVIDIHTGDTLVGRNGGLSIIEDSSDHSGHLGLMRVETEHGHLYLEMDVEVKVLAPPAKEPKK